MPLSDLKKKSKSLKKTETKIDYNLSYTKNLEGKIKRLQNENKKLKQQTKQQEINGYKLLSYHELITGVKKLMNDFATDRLKTFYKNCEITPKKHWRSLVEQVIDNMRLVQK